MTARASRHARQRGQNMVEFSISILVLMIIFLGIMDFGYLFSGYVSAHNAVRGAARFAATHPSAWTNVANPPDKTTIEGNLKLTAVPAVIPNDDSHVTINYIVPTTGSTTGVQCGHYLPSTGYVADNGYAQPDCVAAGHLVQIKATYIYVFMTPMLSKAFSNVTIKADALEFIEG
jgi:Flp pilus assembly protein TadG